MDQSEIKNIILSHLKGFDPRLRLVSLDLLPEEIIKKKAILISWLSLKSLLHY